MDDYNVKAELEVGDWVTLYGVPFRVTAFRLFANKPAAVELSHPLEMMEEVNIHEDKPWCVGTFDCPAAKHTNDCPKWEE